MQKTRVQTESRKDTWKDEKELMLRRQMRACGSREQKKRREAESRKRQKIERKDNRDQREKQRRLDEPSRQRKDQTESGMCDECEHEALLARLGHVES